jgi:hypothetical protein
MWWNAQRAAATPANGLQVLLGEAVASWRPDWGFGGGREDDEGEESGAKRELLLFQRNS